ncbi:MAG TPA: cytochrome c oxidase subunit 3, partial [Gaiellales bacterium]|nr:cytochrome c oxidase subunit 3 [Gaiellales bacterium]
MTSIAAARDMPAPEERVHVSAYHKSLLQSPVFLGMVMFIGSEIMLFGSFFTAYFYIRFSHGEYPFGGFEIPKATTGINTAILVGSSFTMHWALVSASRGRRLGLILGLGLTLLMGLT